MTEQDALGVFAELPPRVRVALVSLLRQLRDGYRVQYHDYPAAVAEYLAGTGLLDVRLPGDGWRTTQFRKNAASAILLAHWSECVGIAREG